tara:strand:- start:1481 stop:2743 length:1263 start_codon:yes stop_codon:yes gene_type:complete
MKIIGFLNKRNSILRRSFLALILNFPAAILALSLNFFASKISNQFGLFYISLSAINIIFSGSLILNLIITEICIKKKGNFDKNKFINIFRYVHTLILFALIFSIPISYLLSNFFGFSFILIIVIIFSSLVSYIAELGRVFMQCKDDFFLAGIYNIAWILIRNISTLGILLIADQIWIAVLFFGLTSLIPFLFIIKFYVKKEGYFTLNYFFNFNKIKKFSFVNIYQKYEKKIKLLFSILSFSILCFSDLILTYLIFDETKLNIISSSLIIPKGIIAFSIPLAHIFFVTLIKNNENNFFNFLKAIISVFLSSLLMVIFFNLTQSYYCGTSKGIDLCDNSFLNFALFNSILFVILRIQILDLNNQNKLFTVQFWIIFLFCYFIYSISSVIEIEEIFFIQKYFIYFLIILSFVKRITRKQIFFK